MTGIERESRNDCLCGCRRHKLTRGSRISIDFLALIDVEISVAQRYPSIAELTNPLYLVGASIVIAVPKSDECRGWSFLLRISPLD